MKNFSDFDKYCISVALDEAKKGAAVGEVPVGAVISANEEIFCCAHNLVEHHGDITKHAEMICIQSFSEKIGDWRLSNATLYSTVEPCDMCLGAIKLSRIKRVVWAAPSKYDYEKTFIDGGLMCEESVKLMKNFFRKTRALSYMEKLMNDVVQRQNKKLFSMARKIVPNITQDDILQPFDFPEVESNLLFKYEEGILDGMMTMLTMVRSEKR